MNRNGMPSRMKITMSPNGRMVLPIEFRKSLGVPKGGELFIDSAENGVLISTMKQNIERAQRHARQYLKPGVSLADELIAERREAAKRELE